MSRKINVDLLSEDQKNKIDNDLVIKIEPTKYNCNVRYIYPHKVEDDVVILPFAFATTKLDIDRPPRNNSSLMSAKFEAGLRDEQKIVKKEAIDVLNKNGSVIISCYCGFGKTRVGINISCSIKMKTLIVVNKVVLIKQWEASINELCPGAKVVCLKPKSDLEEADFYIMNAINVPKMGNNYFNNVGLLLVDEVHLIMAEKLSNLMNFVHPRYLIGLSATPWRTDGLNILLDIYFGETKIIREMNHKHIVYKVLTSFTPKIELTEAGKIQWGSVLDSMANDKKRNQLIVDIIRKYKDRSWLVLVKRVKHGKYLLNALLKCEESVTSLLGSNQEFDKEARILVATSQKAGTGFDHPRLDALMLATDFENFYEQIACRVMRRIDVVPLIFDLVDDHPILYKHFKSRRIIYEKFGGTVKNYE